MFQTPPFVSHRFIRGGHLQTLLASTSVSENANSRTYFRPHSTETVEIEVSHGDRIALHLDQPDAPAKGSVLLIHGLTGCHAAPYMIRLADQFLRAGYRTYRMDLRGFGAVRNRASNLSHAGRSDDVAAALQWMAQHEDPAQPLIAIGISLGGAQLLRAISRVDAGLDKRPAWRDQMIGIAAVCPPIDLVACSENMRRKSRSVYNRYFIGNLIKRLPPGVAARADFPNGSASDRPKTLWELDDRFTAPLSGFDGALDYYQQSSCSSLLKHLQIPTLILASADDPIVPIDCFRNIADELPQSTTLLMPDQGGHVGFIGPGRRCWMDDVLLRWLDRIGKR